MMPLTKDNVEKKIKSLLNELQEKTGVTDEEIINLQKILDLADLSEEK